MRRRGRKEFDEDEYYNFDSSPRRRSKRGCLFTLIGLVAALFLWLVVAGARRAQQNSVLLPTAMVTASQMPSPTQPSTLIIQSQTITQTLAIATQTPTATILIIPELTSTPPQQEGNLNDGEIFNRDELAFYMLDLINSDRQVNGLGAVALDDFASAVGQAHADEMADYNYLSHWNLAGQGPDVRYGLAGGVDMVMENVYSYYQRYDDGSPVPVHDWRKLVFDAQRSLMESPGHRSNILDPNHTHVGIGIAYDPITGELRIAQEFLNRYVTLEPIQREVRPGDSLVINGEILGGITAVLTNLLYEPFPSPLTVEQLNQTSTYQSPAVFLDAFQPAIDPQGRFLIEIPVWPGAKPGLYHVVIWVEIDSAKVPAADVIFSLN